MGPNIPNSRAHTRISPTLDSTSAPGVRLRVPLDLRLDLDRLPAILNPPVPPYGPPGPGGDLAGSWVTIGSGFRANAQDLCKTCNRAASGYQRQPVLAGCAGCPVVVAAEHFGDD